MSRDAPAPPTPLARRYVRYVLGFGVGVAVGLAPFLGTVDIPLFAPLRLLVPEKMRVPAVPLSAFLMGLVAVGVQFAAGERIARRRLRRWFVATFAAILVGVLGMALLHVEVVRTVSVKKRQGKDMRNVAVVVAPSRVDPPPRTCSCDPDLDDVSCLEWMGIDNVEPCWGQRPVAYSRFALTFAYLFLTGSFGALIGLLLLQEDSKKKRKKR